VSADTRLSSRQGWHRLLDVLLDGDPELEATLDRELHQIAEAVGEAERRFPAIARLLATGLFGPPPPGDPE